MPTDTEMQSCDLPLAAAEIREATRRAKALAVNENLSRPALLWTLNVAAGDDERMLRLASAILAELREER